MAVCRIDKHFGPRPVQLNHRVVFQDWFENYKVGEKAHLQASQQFHRIYTSISNVSATPCQYNLYKTLVTVFFFSFGDNLWTHETTRIVLKLIRLSDLNPNCQKQSITIYTPCQSYLSVLAKKKSYFPAFSTPWEHT